MDSRRSLRFAPFVSPYRHKDMYSAWRWFWLSALVGIVAGIGAIAFYYLSALLAESLLTGFAGYHPGRPIREPHVLNVAGPASISLLLLVLLPGVGNFLAGWVVQRLAPDTHGHGTDTAIDAYHRRGGVMKPINTVARFISSVLTLGFGGSGGREGPISAIGAGFGSWLGGLLKLQRTERRILLAAGLAAGVGAIMRMPLASALYAAEVMYRDGEFESEVLVSSTLASILAFCIFSFVTGDFSALFLVEQPFRFNDATDLIFYSALVPVVTLGGAFFVWLFYRVDALTAALKWQRSHTAGLGGLLTGLTAVALFLAVSHLPLIAEAERASSAQSALSVMGLGNGLLQSLLNPRYAEQIGLIDFAHPAWLVAAMLVVIGLGKMLTTAMTVGMGGSAGLFSPALIIGGCLGGAVGAVLSSWFPHVDPRAFVLLGMTGFFGCIAKTPVSAVIMVAELTATYDLLIPAMWVCTLSFLLLGRRAALFPTQPNNRTESPAHRAEMVLDVFSGLKVADVMVKWLRPARTVAPTESLTQIIPKVLNSKDDYFPVVSDAGRLVGVLSLSDIREVLTDETLAALVMARDLATPEEALIVLRPSDSLAEAFEKFSQRDHGVLPVVDDLDRTKLLGTLSRHSIFAEYSERLSAMAEAVQREV